MFAYNLISECKSLILDFINRCLLLKRVVTTPPLST